MPLKEGREWSYLVHDDLGSRVMTVRAGETVRVGPASGRLLMGEGGDSRMAWSGGELLVSEFSAMRFDPPLVLLKPEQEETTWRFEGLCMGRRGEGRVTAHISQKPAALNLSGQEVSTLLVTLTMTFQNQEIELKTWFEQGRGIVRQEQQNDGERVLFLVLEMTAGG